MRYKAIRSRYVCVQHLHATYFPICACKKSRGRPSDIIFKNFKEEMDLISCVDMKWKAMNMEKWLYRQGIDCRLNKRRSIIMELQETLRTLRKFSGSVSELNEALGEMYTLSRRLLRKKTIELNKIHV